MLKSTTRALLTALIAATLAHADLPKHYRLALIQVAYGDAPAGYSVAQLKAAAKEISDYYTRISYLNFNLQISVSSIVPGIFAPPPSKSIFFVIDKSGYATPTPSNEAVIEAVAYQARRDIDFSAIDGIAILNSFPTPSDGDYLAGTVMIPAPSPVAGTYETGQLFERPIDPHLSPQGTSGVFWAPWAEVIGKMIETRSGTVLGGNWDGHPGGFSDSYALMDSCQPCAPGAYSVIGTSFMTGDKRVFNGWLPDSQVAVDSADFTSRTYVLSSLSSLQELVTASCPSCIKTLKVPITPGIYYLVEARARTGGVDTLPTVFSPRGLWDEGIRISRVNESADPPLFAIDSCDSLVKPLGCVRTSSDFRFADCKGPVGFSVDTLPRYCWPYPLFHVGDTFAGDHDIEIAVTGRSGDPFSGFHYTVSVTRGALFMAPDVEVVRRAPFDSGLGFNVSSLPRNQLWIDSSCNGYAADIGPAGMRFGDPAQAQSETLAVGDDLCLGHENRIYARIGNRGTAPANGIRVHFFVNDPSQDQGFIEVGVADAQRFPALASLAPGAQATVYVPYTPPGSPNGPLFSTPGLMVRVDPLQGEISTGNNVAFSGFSRVQAVVGAPSDVPLQGPDLVYVNGPNPATVSLSTIGNLPRGVSVSNGQTPGHLDLTQGQQLHVPIIFNLSGRTAPAAGQYAANVTLSSFVQVPIPSPQQQRTDFRVVAAQTVGIDVVEPSHIDIQAMIQGDLASVVQVSGRLQQPNRNKVLIALDYTDLNQGPRTLLVETGGDGKFEAQLITSPGTPVRALWAGNETNAPTAAGPIVPTQGK